MLLLFVLVGHGQLLLADGVRWDDALFYKLDQTGDYPELRSWMMEMGLPINYLFFRTIFAFPGYGSHLALSFLSIFLCAAILHRYLTGHMRWNFESATLLCALFIFCMPFKSMVLVCTLQYQFSLVLFLLGCHLSEKRFGPHGNWWTLAGLAAFFLSFNTASLLAFFYVYVLASGLHFLQRRGLHAHAVVDWLGKSWLLIAWPFAYFAWKLAVFPTHGLYTNYNKLNFDLRRIADTSRSFFENGFVDPASLVMRLQPRLLLAILLLAGLLLVMFRFMPARKPAPAALSLAEIRLPWYLVASAVCLAFLPYAMVGQTPRPMYWESRHLLLFAIAIPFAAFAVIRLVSLLSTAGRTASPRPMARLLAALVCAAFGVFGYVNYYLVQIGSIKQQAIVESLRKQPHLMDFDYFSVVDRVNDFGGNRLNLYEATHENYYGWALIFTQAWGDERWFGFASDEFRKDKPFRHARYGTSKINPDGKWCEFTISPASSRTQWQVYSRYYWYKFVDRSKLQSFLGDLVSVSECIAGRTKP